MIRWQYLCLAVVDGKPHTQNGFRVEQPWIDNNAFDYLNELGSQGWELVAASEISKSKNTLWLYFKRPAKTS